jgi:hypothetical protein
VTRLEKVIRTLDEENSMINCEVKTSIGVMLVLDMMRYKTRDEVLCDKYKLV